ncbi:MAG: alpha-ketoglutarate-dependent dioxygenase AlkB [Candidatus Baltobacteraceae bacterium]
MTQQTDLFGAAPQILASGDGGAIVYHPAVFAAQESRQLFERFERSLPWTRETMWMYDRTVDVPRLIARFGDTAEMPPELLDVKQRIESYLHTAFNAVSVQYYRDAADSVAWHNDHRDELVPLPVIALLSLGATRQMQIRSKTKPRRNFRIDLQAGSVLVMSGRSQEFWEHTIPKSPRPVAPRISVALRQRR